MRGHRVIGAIACGLAVWLAASAPTGAQSNVDQMSQLQIALACAPPPVIGTAPHDVLHVAGAQTASARSLFDGHDILVLDAGADKGVALGQEFFIRRRVTIGMFITDESTPRGVHTAAWARVVAVDANRSLAAVEHDCGPIYQGDYLEPFVAPAVPANIDKTDTSGNPDFESAGRIVFGDYEHATAGVGEFMIVDKGADQGATPGTRYAVYRSVDMWWQQGDHIKHPPMPLASVGEAVVVSSAKSLSVVRIVAGRDAIRSGDLIVPRK